MGAKSRALWAYRVNEGAIFPPSRAPVITGLTDELLAEYACHEPARPQPATCDECGAALVPGDWPWCRGKAEDHVR
jgi:hypothetical protein